MEQQQEEPTALRPSGPLALPLVGHLYLLKKPLHHTLAELSSRHGPLLLRFGCRQVLVVSSASLAHESFTKNDVTFANRPRLPSARSVTYGYTTLGTSSYGAHWRNVRRIATMEILSSQRLNAMSDDHAAEVRTFVRRLFRTSDGHGHELRIVKLKERLLGLTANLIMGMLAGKKYYGDHEDGASVETRVFQETVEEITKNARASNIGDFLPGLLQNIDFGGSRKNMAKVAVKFDKFMQGILDETRRDKSCSEKTMIADLLEMQQKDLRYYTDDIIKAMIMSFLVAGTDTSAQTVA